MNAETLTALKESIESWEMRQIACVADIGANKCALCKLFNNCEMCIIAEKGYPCCRATPHERLWNYLISTSGVSIKNRDPKIIEQYRKEEVDFLISLLPEGETCE